MNRILALACFVIILLASAEVHAQILPNYGAQRTGLSAFSFLKNELNPRTAGMAGAGVALSGDGFSAGVNPAALAEQEHLSLSLAHMMIGSGIQQSWLSVVNKLPNEARVALTLNSMNSGAMEVRTEFQPNGTGELFYVGNHALGLSYSTRLSDMFSAGISLNYLLEQMAGFSNHALTADVGLLYTTDFKDLRFAVCLQHFGGNTSLSGDELKVRYNRNGIALEQYTVPTVFKMGLSMVPYRTERAELTALAELRHPNDNSENVRIGLEYTLREILFLRTGYKFSVNGQHWPAFGAGYRTRISGRPLMLHYGIQPTNFMGTQHHFGINYQWSSYER